MAVPDFQQFFRPMLETTALGGWLKARRKEFETMRFRGLIWEGKA